MLYRPLGPSGIEASAIAFGAWAIGGWPWGASDEAQAIEAIRAAIDAGINFVDTAPIYGFGRSEEIVGKAIAGRRDEIIVATKCGLRWDGDETGEFFTERTVPGSDRPLRVFKNLRPESIRREVEASLARLGIDCIDLYQTHWQEATTPIADTMGCLLDLKREGKIRAIGVSNASPEQMEAYRAVGRLDADQERYSMLDREREGSNLDYCLRKGVAFLAYSPLGHGLLTGKFGAGHALPEGDFRRDHPRFSTANVAKAESLLGALRPLADVRGLTLAQLVIAWTLQQPGCTHALCGARSARQARENAAAADARLTAEELRQISNAVAELA